jgi:hypothetical protein
MGTYSLIFFFMWLFDNLLKNPSNETSTSGMGMGGQSSQSSGSTGNPPAQDPLAQAGIKIEKTEETTLQTTPVFQNMTQTPPQEETPPQAVVFNPATQNVWAEEDASSILINSDSSSTSEVPSGVNMTQEASQGVVEETILTPPVQENTQTFENSPIFGNTQTPEQVTPPLQSTETTASSGDPMWLGGILWLSETTQESPVSVASEVAVEVQEESTSPIAAIIEDVYAEKEELHEEEKITESTFTDPASFIQDSLTKIEHMLEAMHEKHDAKLDEALGYKSEKERFAGLEAQAYKDAESMTAEMDHAERMKAYFTKELKHASEKENTTSQVESVETTLTTLAVKNSVEWVTEKKEAQKRAKAKMDV